MAQPRNRWIPGEVERLTDEYSRSTAPVVAARLEGIDLAHFSDADVKSIRDRLIDHPVVIIPGQTVVPEVLVDFASRFGPLKDMDMFGKPDQFYMEQSNLDKDGNILPPDDMSRLANDGNKLWHSDMPYYPMRAKMTFLLSAVLPPSGSVTEFCDTREAYESLERSEQEHLNGLWARHSLRYSRLRTGFGRWTAEMSESFSSEIRRPLVETHRESGRKALMIGAHIGALDGLPVVDSELLVDELINRATTHEQVYIHEWRSGDLVIWDNTCTMHRVRPFKELDEPRKLFGVRTLDVVDGEGQTILLEN